MSDLMLQASAEDDYDQRNVMAEARFKAFLTKFPPHVIARGLDTATDYAARVTELRHDMAPFFAPALEFDIDDICHQLQRRVDGYVALLRNMVLEGSNPDDAKLARQWNVDNRQTRDRERREMADQRSIVEHRIISVPIEGLGGARDDDDDDASSF